MRDQLNQLRMSVLLIESPWDIVGDWGQYQWPVGEDTMAAEYLFSLIKLYYSPYLCNLEADVNLGKSFNLSI